MLPVSFSGLDRLIWGFEPMVLVEGKWDTPPAPPVPTTDLPSCSVCVGGHRASGRDTKPVSISPTFIFGKCHCKMSITSRRSNILETLHIIPWEPLYVNSNSTNNLNSVFNWVRHSICYKTSCSQRCELHSGLGGVGQWGLVPLAQGNSHL